MKKVLICANPDLNYIDGSSIWLQTIALIFAETKQVKVDFIARSPVERLELYSPVIDNPSVNIIDGCNSQYLLSKKEARLSMPQFAQLADSLDQINHYDVIVVRGYEIAESLLAFPEALAKCWIYLTDIPQNISEFSNQQKSVLKQVATQCSKVLCQTNEFRLLWKEVVPELSDNKLSVYSPVIPDFDADSFVALKDRPQIAIYAGKYKNEWKTLEMATLWPQTHAVIPDSQLLMIGDKIHDEKTPINYKKRMLDVLQNTTGLEWKGAVSRAEVSDALKEARVGLSWRCETLNDIVEYSTKILEYGGAGCAAILNRNPLHEKLLGKDYPLFANTESEYISTLRLALTDADIAQVAAKKLTNLALQHTFSVRVNIITNWLNASDSFAPRKRSKKQTVLVAGHDLKFFTLLQSKLEATGKYEFITDQWQGHNKHDSQKSMALLQQADIIFCEWCLGNLQWYSHNKLPHQKLVARFHLQERELPYVEEANWDNIDHISYVSEFIRREGQKAFGFPFEKTSVISNLLDEDKFTPKKKTGDARFTLGLIGSAPARKRLDRAIDLLEELLKEDNRYCLRVKGKHPLDYGWLLKREDELSYYQSIFKRINENPILRHKVIFDPAGDDINEWFTMVGFILSPSDFESFHMAIGEGMLTNTYPIIWDWDGAAEIWGEEYIIKSKNQAVVTVRDSPVNLQNIKSDIPFMLNARSVVDEWIKVL